MLGPLDYYPATGNPYHFVNTTIITTLGALVLGLILGAFEVYVANRFFAKGTFWGKVSTKTIIYIVSLSLFFILATMGASSAAMQKPIWDSQVLDDAYLFVTNFAFGALLIYAGAIISLILFILDMSDNIGQQVVTNFLLGRYHRPLVEERIFMFLDMKSSTTIAEKLGHHQYFKLLRTYYSLMTDPILKSKGEIYQYVGDELVISWRADDGFKDLNFLRCFFNIKQLFKEQDQLFKDDFGLVPTFKAGIHYGEVTSGEIGQIKKEVLFTGDVLNATARVQSLCNENSVDLLVSEELLEQFDLPQSFQKEEIGEYELRGRVTRMKLYTLSEYNQSVSLS